MYVDICQLRFRKEYGAANGVFSVLFVYAVNGAFGELAPLKPHYFFVERELYFLGIYQI